MMKIFRICRGNQTGQIDIELQQNTHTESENGKLCYSSGQNLGHYVDDYCSSTTINGIRYFGENRTVVEKIWWAISIILSLCCGIWLIIRSYDKWQNSPVVINFAAQETPIWTLPFPAVTICPYSRVRSSIFNYTYYMEKEDSGVTLTAEEKRKMEYMFLHCPKQGHRDTNYPSKFIDERMFDFLEEVKSLLPNDFHICKHAGNYNGCSYYFYPIITEGGICYTFNLIDRSQMLSDTIVHYKKFHKTKVTGDWNLESGFTSSSIDTYPERAISAGVPYGLVVLMAVRRDDLDYQCATSLQGVKVHIGQPYSLPIIGQQHILVPNGKSVQVVVSPVITTTSAEVKEYNPKRRNCYLSSERPLKYFKVYTQSNCDLECRTNYILQKCGCVAFYMPRENGTRICGPRRIGCLRDAENSFVKDNLKRKLKSTAEIDAPADKPYIIDCECLPSCTSMDYDIETTQLTWDWKTEFKEYTSNFSDGRLDLVHLQVFFKANQFLTSERNELYGYPEFIANVGGLLGLFVGFTALSFIEIIYYLTLRILCNIYMFGKRNWSGKN